MYSDVIFHSKTFITSLNYRDQITPLIIPLSNYLSTNYPIFAQKKIREERSHKFFKAKISKARRKFKKSSVISLSNGRTLRGVSSVEAGE